MFAHTSQVQLSSSSGQSFRPIGEPTRARELPSKPQSTVLASPPLCESRPPAPRIRPDPGATSARRCPRASAFRRKVRRSVGLHIHAHILTILCPPTARLRHSRRQPCQLLSALPWRLRKLFSPQPARPQGLARGIPPAGAARKPVSHDDPWAGMLQRPMASNADGAILGALDALAARRSLRSWRKFVAA